MVAYEGEGNLKCGCEGDACCRVEKGHRIVHHKRPDITGTPYGHIPHTSFPLLASVSSIHFPLPGRVSLLSGISALFGVPIKPICARGGVGISPVCARAARGAVGGTVRPREKEAADGRVRVLRRVQVELSVGECGDRDGHKGARGIHWRIRGWCELHGAKNCANSLLEVASCMHLAYLGTIAHPR